MASIYRGKLGRVEVIPFFPGANRPPGVVIREGTLSCTTWEAVGAENRWKMWRSRCEPAYWVVNRSRKEENRANRAAQANWPCAGQPTASVSPARSAPTRVCARPRGEAAGHAKACRPGVRPHAHTLPRHVASTSGGLPRGRPLLPSYGDHGVLTSR
jgi:hypothetical protein